MIIRLKKANFSSNNIGQYTTEPGTLTFNVSPSNASWTLTCAAMSPSTKTGTGNTTWANIPAGSTVSYEVSLSGYNTQKGSISIYGNTSKTITLSEVGSVTPPVTPEPEKPSTGGGSGETITGTLQLFSGALSVVSGENYYRPDNSNKTRMNSSSTTEPTGVYVENGYTITLTGVSGLRFDYVYAESAGPNSHDKTVNAIKGVGTGSKFVAADYFPLNKTGESNTITITNNLGKGYYYHFAIAGPNKSEKLTPSNYNITYTIEPVNVDTTKYTLIQGGINITTNESVYGNVLGPTDVNYNKRGHTEPAIFIKNGESVTISGLTGLKLDAIWYNSSVMNNANAVGSASNKDSSKYFLLTDGTTDTYTYTNSTGSDYYYAFIVRNTNNTNFTASDYTLTIK